MISSFGTKVCHGRIFSNQISWTGEFDIAPARFFISLDTLFLELRIVIGVFSWRDLAISLWSCIFARTGTPEISSICFRLYSWRGLLILFTIIPFTGVFCSCAISAAFIVV